MRKSGKQMQNNTCHWKKERRGNKQKKSWKTLPGRENQQKT